MKQEIKRKKGLLKTIYEENSDEIIPIVIICAIISVCVLIAVYPKISFVIMGILILTAILILSIYKISSFILRMLDISRLPLTKEEMENRNINTPLEYIIFLAPICIRKKKKNNFDGSPKNSSYYRLSNTKTVEIYKSMINIFGEEEVSMFLRQSINAIKIENLSNNIEITDIEIIHSIWKNISKKAN